MTGSVYLPAPRASVAASPWLKAAAIMAVLHGAAFASIALSTDQSAPENMMGGDAILEIASLVTTAQSAESTEQTAREGADQSQTPEVLERLAKRVEEAQTEQSSRRPPEEDLRMAQQQTQRQTDSPDIEQTSEAAAAQPQAMAQEASVASEESLASSDQSETVAAAPDGGNARQAQRKIEAWQRKLFMHIAKFKSYPEAARRARATGETLLGFSLARQGVVSHIQVVRSSGSALLDEAAVEVLRRASPMPPLPAELRGHSFELTLPMKFSLRS